MPIEKTYRLAKFRRCAKGWTEAADNSMTDCMVHLWRYRATSEERNFIEPIKAPIFLEAVLAIETI